MALAWCFPDEASDYADQVLVSLKGHAIAVPAVWSLEVGNAILVGERRRRLKQSEIQQFVDLLDGLSILQDAQPVAENLRTVLPLARRSSLSAYDAAYLELAIRHGAPLASLDNHLRKAAAQAGIRSFP